LTSKHKGLVWILAAVFLAAVLAGGLPRLARHMPWRLERWLGGIFDATPRGGSCRSPGAAGAALEKLVRRVYPIYPDDARLPISIEVTRGDTVNAYATLGGHIFVIDALLQHARSPEELAGVLAHEIEHVRHRHIIQGLAASLFTLGALSAASPDGSVSGSRVAYTLLQLKFSRDQEHEADVAGLERLRSARISGRAFEEFFARASATGAMAQMLSSHPADEERAALAARFQGYPTEPVLTPAEWESLRGICR
jgi:predicted Zn-dependent protease